MKTSFTVLFAVLLSLSAHAANVSTNCGVNKSNGEKIRLSIELQQEDEFSAPVIVTINGKKPMRMSADGASGFGPKGYENITLKMTGKCEGSADYSHYNPNMPMNPMEKLALKCVCASK